MKKIAIENSLVVLEAGGPWLWENGQTIEAQIHRGDARQLTVNGVPALLRNNVVAAIKEEISKNKYRHLPAASNPGGIASVEVTVNDSSLSSHFLYRGEPLVTSDTSGTFTLSAREPSTIPGSPPVADPIGIHSGSWRFKEAGQEMCLEAERRLSPSLASQTLSMVLDLVPLVGQGKAIIETVSGVDPITHEPVPQWVAVSGLIPGAKLIKGVKVLKATIKVSNKLPKITQATKVSEILKLKKGSIQRAPLPKGSPNWDELKNMDWGEIEKGARNNLPGYKTIRKLLSDKRFNK